MANDTPEIPTPLSSWRRHLDALHTFEDRIVAAADRPVDEVLHDLDRTWEAIRKHHATPQPDAMTSATPGVPGSTKP